MTAGPRGGAAVLLACVLLVLAACRPSAVERRGWRLAAADVEHAPGHTLDIYVPADPAAAPLPVVVALHGCCGQRSDLVKLAEAIAAHDVVVVNADWPGVGMRGRFPRSYEIAACAVRYARANAARLGGDPARVAVLGWSDGALPAASIALAPQRWSASRCHVRDEITSIGLIGVDGFYGWRAPVASRYVTRRSVRFVGGSPEQAPAAWRAATPYHWIERAARTSATLIVASPSQLTHDARSFARALRRHGHDAAVVELAAARGASPLSPRTALGRNTARAVAVALADCRHTGATGCAPSPRRTMPAVGSGASVR